MSTSAESETRQCYVVWEGDRPVRVARLYPSQVRPSSLGFYGNLSGPMEPDEAARIVYGEPR
jgi:hypothetical protein